MLYELSNREVVVLQAACAVAQDQMAENAESSKRYAKNCHLPMSDRDRPSGTRSGRPNLMPSARHSTRVENSPPWRRPRRRWNDEGFAEPAALVGAGSADLVHGGLCGGRQKAQSSPDGGADAGHLAAGNVGELKEGATMQRYAIVVYDKRNGDVFTTVFQAEDGAAAVAAMNRKDWGTSLRPLSLILLPKPGSEK